MTTKLVLGDSVNNGGDDGKIHCQMYEKYFLLKLKSKLAINLFFFILKIILTLYLLHMFYLKNCI